MLSSSQRITNDGTAAKGDSKRTVKHNSTNDWRNQASIVDEAVCMPATDGSQYSFTQAAVDNGIVSVTNLLSKPLALEAMKTQC